MFGKIASFGAALALLLVTMAPGSAASPTCEVTDLPRRQCCASKASPMPPCCQKACSIPGRIIR